jgi:hypothetical protein
VSHAKLRVGTLLLAASALMVSGPARADEATAEPPPVSEGPLSRLSGTIEADFTNAYYFRGILQERNGFIAQPWGEIAYSLYQSDTGFIRDLSIAGGVWSSFHTEETGATEAPRSVYEVDWYPVISLAFPGGVSLATTYYFYTSPNGAFSTADELNFKLAWDDSETLGRYSVQPWINLAIETHNTAFGDREGVGLQMGVEPTLFSVGNDTYPVTFTAPVELGLALNDYYEREDGSENTFGYLTWGLSASFPLAFMPANAGEWSFTLTGKGYYFSNTLAAANKGDDLYPVFTAAVGVSF